VLDAASWKLAVDESESEAVVGIRREDLFNCEPQPDVATTFTCDKHTMTCVSVCELAIDNRQLVLEQIAF
jgi:hypothetical protein